MWFWDLLGNALGAVVIGGAALLALALLLAVALGAGYVLLYKPLGIAAGAANLWLGEQGLNFRIRSMDVGVMVGLLALVSLAIASTRLGPEEWIAGWPIPRELEAKLADVEVCEALLREQNAHNMRMNTDRVRDELLPISFGAAEMVECVSKRIDR